MLPTPGPGAAIARARPRASAVGDRWIALALVAPALLIAGLVVVGGIGMSVIQSVGLLPLVGEAAFTLDAYVANGDELLTGLALSLGIATASTVLSCIIGLAAVGGPWWVAVVLEYTWKESTFVALVVARVLATRVARYDETAALLGASAPGACGTSSSRSRRPR